MALRDSLGRESHPARSYVIGFVKERNLALLTPTTITDVVRTADGLFYNVMGIPDGAFVDGDLELYDRYPDLRFLPENMTVEGNMHIYDNRIIEMLPRGLTVRGRLEVHGCPSLCLLRSGLTVGGRAAFIRCGELRAAEKGCVFQDDLHVDHKRMLRQKFTLVGRAYIGLGKDRREVAYPVKGLWRRWVKAV
jgi:hypothetical protein